jgi:RNA polymerase sigma-70 factor (ECF subfamily)
MSIDRLAVAYAVGRSTAARWLADARATLLEETRRDLHERLRVTPSEIRDLGQALDGEIEVSVLRLLESRADPGTTDGT